MKFRNRKSVFLSSFLSLSLILQSCIRVAAFRVTCDVYADGEAEAGVTLQSNTPLLRATVVLSAPTTKLTRNYPMNGATILAREYDIRAKMSDEVTIKVTVEDYEGNIASNSATAACR